MNMEFNQHIIEYMTHCYSRQLRPKTMHMPEYQQSHKAEMETALKIRFLHSKNMAVRK